MTNNNYDKNVTFELCSYCENEVALKPKLERQACPKCGKMILPCSMCIKKDCSKCKL